MTMFQRIREAFFRAVSHLNKDDDDRLDMGALEGDLRHYVHKLNKSNSAASVVPLRKAS